MRSNQNKKQHTIPVPSCTVALAVRFDFPDKEPLPLFEEHSNINPHTAFGNGMNCTSSKIVIVVFIVDSRIYSCFYKWIYSCFYSCIYSCIQSNRSVGDFRRGVCLCVPYKGIAEDHLRPRGQTSPISVNGGSRNPRHG